MAATRGAAGMLSGLHGLVDRRWRSCGSLFGRSLLFSKGWGDGAFEMAADFRAWLDSDPPDIRIQLDTLRPSGPVPHPYFPARATTGIAVQEFEFLSPALANPIVRNALPDECRIGRFLLVTPTEGPTEAVTLHLPATGDHWYWMRLGIAATLAQKHKIGSVILEGPWYGRRTPSGQIGAKLRFARELLLLGATTVEESRAILHWLSETMGYSRLGITGFSQGGLHSAMAASLVPFSVACVCSLAPHSAVPVFTPPGELSHNVAWESLASDLPAGSQSLTQAVERMRDLFTVTDVTKFPRRPFNEAAVTLLSGSEDLYVPQAGTLGWEEAWPLMHSEKLNCGHVTGFLGLAQERVPEALAQAFNRCSAMTHRARAAWAENV